MKRADPTSSSQGMAPTTGTWWSNMEGSSPSSLCWQPPTCPYSLWVQGQGCPLLGELPLFYLVLLSYLFFFAISKDLQWLFSCVTVDLTSCKRSTAISAPSRATCGTSPGRCPTYVGTRTRPRRWRRCACCCPLCCGCCTTTIVRCWPTPAGRCPTWRTGPTSASRWCCSPAWCHGWCSCWPAGSSPSSWVTACSSTAGGIAFITPTRRAAQWESHSSIRMRSES